MNREEKEKMGHKGENGDDRERESRLQEKAEEEKYEKVRRKKKKGGKKEIVKRKEENWVRDRRVRSGRRRGSGR